MSTASTQMAMASRADASVTGVSLGYDRMRFLAPVFFGDTITVNYTIASVDKEKLRATADIRITNQDGVLVAVATHVLKWVRNA
jgi:3-hydroxybutyryl-CoA dehydratase